VVEDFLGFFLIGKIEQKQGSVEFTFLFEGITYFGKSKKNLFLKENYFYGGMGKKHGHIVYFDVIFFIDNTLLFSYFLSFLEFCRIPGITKKMIEKIGEFDAQKFFYLWQENLFLELHSLLNYTPQKMLEIESQWKERKKSLLISILLMHCGLSLKNTKKIYKIHKEKSFELIKNNPYELIYSIGFGFKTADKVAQECGIEKNSVERIKGGILYLLKEEEKIGNTLVRISDLITKLKLLLQVDLIDTFEISLNSLIFEKKIIRIDSIIASLRLYSYEKEILNFFISERKRSYDVSFKSLVLDNFSEEQKHAIKGAITNHYSVITGAAGTGKSSIVKAIYHYQKSAHKKIIMVAPTGRASQRMKEIDQNIEAITIHKLLSWQRIENTKHNLFQEPLDFEHIIIDESSMIDTQLLWLLLKNVSKKTQLTFLGDNNQLPPVGYGEPFHDIIEKKIIPVFFLTQIFRQKDNYLLDIASSFSQGEVPKKLISKNSKIFIQISKIQLQAVIVEMVDKFYNVEKKILEVQFITFLNKGYSGSVFVNKLVQLSIQKKREKVSLQIFNKFYLHDVVMVTKNDYKKDIRNGQLGVIIMINDQEPKQIFVQFAEKKIISFNEEEGEVLDLAYAINVYKSQGSEYKNIIMLIFLESFFFLNKKSLYTVITRAKENVLCVGEKKALYCGIKSKKNLSRNTIIKYLLEEYKNK
jgi:exodeoxyribonuclease V alpha subunit